MLTEKLGLQPEVFAGLLELIEELPGEVVGTPPNAEARSGDVADDRIVASALAAGAGILVSGDRRHLLPSREVDGMRIVRPQELLAELAG